jgi:hypothetical protein
MESDHDRAVQRARRFIRSYSTGTLLVDSTPYDQTHYIIDPHTGSLIMSVDHEALHSTDVVLVLPEDRFDANIRLSLELSTEIQEEASDRFLAYHGQQPSPVWVKGQINFAKIDSGEVITQEELEQPNILVSSLSGLCKKLNNDRKALRELCRLLTKLDIEDPIAVGIDDSGFDVRARFGVVRVELPSQVETQQQAEDVLAALLGGVL